MSLERIVIGYREGDRRRHQLADQYGVFSIAVGKCAAGCGYPVYFVQSGQDAVRSRDAEVVCQECWDRYKNEIQAEL